MTSQRRRMVTLLSISTLVLLMLAAVFAATAAVGPASPAAVPARWQSEVIDMPGFFDGMSDRSLAYDSAGNLHLVYGGDRLYHAVYDGQGWQVEIVDEAVGVGTGAAVALDADDRPHISYLDLPNVKLKYAHWTGQEWALEVVDAAYPYTDKTSIAVDGSGRPHIAYNKFEWLPPDYNCPGMGYATWTGSAWQVERFDDCGYSASLALDSSGEPHISFQGAGGLLHASKQGGAWNVDVVGSPAGLGSSIAVDSNDRPHVAYIDDDENGQLVYASWDGANWVLDPIQSAEDGLNVSLVLDSTDTPHIAYRYTYITWSGSQWVISDTVSGPQALAPGDLRHSSFNAIALNAADLPAISFGYNNWGTITSVNCARFDGADWTTDQVDTAASAGSLNALALDSEGNPHVGYYVGVPGWGAAITYAHRPTDTWNTEIITGTYFPSSLHSGYDISLALDESDLPHLSFWYSEYYTSALYYGHFDGDAWHLEPIADDADGPSDLELDSLGRPHVAFVDNGILKHAFRTEVGWTVEDVTAGVNNRPAALALDGADRPRIVYAVIDGSGSYLRYAVWTGSEWLFDDIDQLAPGMSHGSADLALDGDQRPHVAYLVYDDDDSVVRYATWTGSEWLTETVDDRQWSKSQPSIALDPSGNPLLAYSYLGIQIASRADGAWTIQQVSAARCYGDVSLAAVGSDLAVSYYDSTGHGLVLAEPLPLTEHVYLPLGLKP